MIALSSRFFLLLESICAACSIQTVLVGACSCLFTLPLSVSPSENGGERFELSTRGGDAILRHPGRQRMLSLEKESTTTS